MSAFVIALATAAEAKFQLAPGIEKAQTLIPGEKSLMVITEGTGALLSTGAVTLVLLPAIAAGLYMTGHRVAGPLVGLFAVGLFMAQMFGARA